MTKPNLLNEKTLEDVLLKPKQKPITSFFQPQSSIRAEEEDNSPWIKRKDTKTKASKKGVTVVKPLMKQGEPLKIVSIVRGSSPGQRGECTSGQHTNINSIAELKRWKLVKLALNGNHMTSLR